MNKLYHGTTAVNAAQIANDMVLQPRVGPLRLSAYPPDVVPMVFASAGIFRAINAAKWHVKKNRNLKRFAPQDVAHAALLIITDCSNFVHKTLDQPELGTEEFDFCSLVPVKVNRIITGFELMQFLIDHPIET